LVAPRTGIGWYTYHLIEGFGRLEEDWSVDLLLNRPSGESFGPRVHERVVPFPNTVRLRKIWEEALLPRTLRKILPEVWHSPMTVIPRNLGRIPAVATVHDIAFHLFPEIQPPAYRNYWTRWTRIACEQADRIIAVSEATRRDLLEHFRVDPAKVKVVHEAADPFMSEPAEPGELEKIRSQLGFPDRFLLFVGTLEPRKNLPFLLSVYRLAKAQGKELPPLLVAGGKGWLHDSISEEMAGLGEAVRPLGYLDRPSLRALYREATLVLVPSKYEGFGLQAMEAMAAGGAVIAADLSSLPEVVGEGGVLLPVTDPRVWVDNLVRLVEDSSARERLREKGLDQASRFSWKRAARETLTVYREAISAKS
jgi:glycosyltransferase involved in cell wall biosynthesis